MTEWDYILHTETLEQDICRMFKELYPEMRQTKARRKNVNPASSKNPWQAMYNSKEVQDNVYELYREDFARFEVYYSGQTP